MKKYTPICANFPHFLHGGDYNPEQWIQTPEIWETDMKLMKEANCNEMTVGIFSWAEIEKEEGKFDFSWLDTIMDKIYENGGRVILATPSGARPQWLAEKYPEVLRVLPNKQRIECGYRHNHCYTSPIYREKVRIINEMLAERYAKHPALAGWHLSNEYNGACYCSLCTEKFQEWLREKYSNDIEKLNHAWWTRFWSHRYDKFEQINPPKESEMGGEGGTNGLNLDWKRFVSDQTIDFAQKEAESIRKYSDKAITTNCLGIYAGYDHRKMAKCLDVYSNDFYPAWFKGTEAEAKAVAFVCALCRGMKDGKPFMVMESAPGINIWGMNFRKIKTTGQQILEAFLYIANGADTLQYFQWRKGRGSGEKFHGAVVDHYGGTDNRVFQTVKKIGSYLKKMDGVIGTGIEAQVAITYDYDTRWALDGEAEIKWSSRKNGYQKMTNAFFYALWEQNIAADIIGYDTDFSKYKIVCLPVPYLMDEKIATKIKTYVEKGGTIIATYLTAVANDTDLCYLGGVPGAGLRELFGLRVDEVDNYEEEGCVYQNHVQYQGKEYPVESIAEEIIAEGATPLAWYQQGEHKGNPAVLENRYGKGKAYYIGFAGNDTFLYDFMKTLLQQTNMHPDSEFTAQKGVHIMHRQGDGQHYYFVLNCTDDTKEVTLHKKLWNLLEEKEETGVMKLAPCGVKIYYEQKKEN